MKKRWLVCILCFLFLSSCDFNAPLRNRMREYYTNDDNYVEISGTIVTVEYQELAKTYLFEIEVSPEFQDIYYSTRLLNGNVRFDLLCDTPEQYEFQSGDELIFTTAIFNFYAGHHYPLIAIQRGDEVLLTFEKGKADYLKWIETLFL